MESIAADARRDRGHGLLHIASIISIAHSGVQTILYIGHVYWWILFEFFSVRIILTY